MDITSLSDFMTPVRRVRHCANRTTIRYIPMQSSNSLATRLLANELNFSLSPCFVLSLLPHHASPFLARFHCRHRSGKTSTSVYNSKEYYIVLERYNLFIVLCIRDVYIFVGHFWIWKMLDAYLLSYEINSVS